VEVPAARPITVVVADDDHSTVIGVRSALDTSGFTVVAEAATADDAVRAAVLHHPDLCLLDVRMPGSGLLALVRIVASCPDTACVMLSASDDDDDLFAALAAGAWGYLLKDTDPERLPHALRGVLRGEAALPRALVSRLVATFRTRTQRRMPLIDRAGGTSLTPKEWEVLELLHGGRTTAEVAARLDIAAVTVRTHVAAVLKKLQVPDRDAAFRLLERAER
jgi:DNA-binding NarL/FixJ family response regulator